MKKLLFTIAALCLIVSCTAPTVEEEAGIEKNLEIRVEQSTDIIQEIELSNNGKSIEKCCPCTPTDRNCDGIPDSQQ